MDKGRLSAIVSLNGTLAYRARADGSPCSAINQARGTYTQLPENGYDAGAGVHIHPDDEDFTQKTKEALNVLQHDRGLHVTGRCTWMESRSWANGSLSS